MAQAEDTELRDLVIEALERNGSLAKIRALLRANIFLAFEDDCENIKQNVNLDNILKLPEGLLALSLIHEFLEFCCLKNTLFVYMSESRQGNEYNYVGKKSLGDKLNISKNEMLKEPILLSLIKKFISSNLKAYDKNCGEDQNCTYILHDSQSSTTSNTNSDNSSDEKNKLHLQLQLDHSDTDTSSDSMRDKSSSEYIPGDHILNKTNNNHNNLNEFVKEKSVDDIDATSKNNLSPQDKPDRGINSNEIKMTNSSSDSTSYIELKPFNSLDEKMLNTAGLPIKEVDFKNIVNSKIFSVTNLNKQSKSGTLSSLSPVSLNKESENKIEANGQTLDGHTKTEETSDFSYRDDFSSSISKVVAEHKENKPEIGSDDLEKSSNKSSSVESPHQISQSSQSSVSLSDVADLISDKSSLCSRHNRSIKSPTVHSQDKIDIKSSKLYSDDSGDFTESPVPSLSNLSLDIHSD